MIRVTWIQHRREALLSMLLLAVTGLFLGLTGVNMASDFERSGMARCIAAGVRAVGVFAAGTPCDAIQGLPLRWATLTTGAKLALMTLPALLGVFIAAPLLSREFEHGTCLLAWSQSITRLRWAAIKLALLAASTVMAAAALAAVVLWWHSPLDLALSYGQWTAFDIEGIAPVAYALFAFALGTLAGLMIRRVVPAMALTLFVYAAARLVVELIRPHFLTPLTGSAMNLPQGSWVLSQNYYADAQGDQVSLDQVNDIMGGYNGASASGLMDYMRQHGIRLLADYQPPDRFWTFQLIEAAVFLGLSAALIAVSFWWLRRRG